MREHEIRRARRSVTASGWLSSVALGALALGMLGETASAQSVRVEGRTLKIDGLDDPTAPDQIAVEIDGAEYWVHTIGSTVGGERIPMDDVDDMEVALFSGSDAFEAPDLALPMTVSGGDGFDRIETGSGPDIVTGNTEDDVIITGDGDDLILGGDGNDVIDAGDGDDVVYGFAPITNPAVFSTAYQDYDTIHGGPGSDYIEGGPANDVIYGGLEAMWLSGVVNEIYGISPVADDFFMPQPDDDTIYCEGGASHVYGGPGNDVVIGGIENDEVFGQTGADEIHGGYGDDELHGGMGPDKIYGEENTDRLWGGPGNDLVDGGDGSDEMYGNGGADNMFGGTGNDYLDGGGQADYIEGNDDDDNLIGGVSDVADDILLGGNGDDRLYGGGGADDLRGGYGVDLLVSIDQASDDTCKGGPGFDSFWFDPGDTLDSPSAAELESNVHEVSSIRNFDDYTWDGDEIPDPNLAPGLSYQKFDDEPLFPWDGPEFDDVMQQGVGDCWLLAGLAATAYVNQNAIYQTIIPLPDDTYLIEWGNVHYRHDTDLPVNNQGALVYANLAGSNNDNGLWVALIEKMVADRRFQLFEIFSYGEYDSAEIGSPRKVFDKLDGNPSPLFLRSVAAGRLASAFTVIDNMEAFLDAGETIGVCATVTIANRHIYSFHCYAVLDVVRPTSGEPEVLLYNPWKADVRQAELNAGTKEPVGANDGFIQITAREFLNNFYLTTFVPTVSISVADFSAFDE